MVNESPESDISEEEKASALQAEHDRLLSLQNAANQKLRDVEIAKDEARALLLRALLDRDNFSPELLELQREETLRRIREQIENVVKAPSEVQPNVLEVTSNDIADTVGKSRAAMETVKRVSNQQFSTDESEPSGTATPFEPAALPRYDASSLRSKQLKVSGSASTLVPTPGKGKAKVKEQNGTMPAYNGSSPESIRTPKKTWGDRLARLMKSPRASEERKSVADQLERPSIYGFGLTSLPLVCGWCLQTLFVSMAPSRTYPFAPPFPASPWQFIQYERGASKLTRDVGPRGPESDQ